MTRTIPKDFDTREYGGHSYIADVRKIKGKVNSVRWRGGILAGTVIERFWHVAETSYRPYSVAGQSFATWDEAAQAAIAVAAKEHMNAKRQVVLYQEALKAFNMYEQAKQAKQAKQGED